MGVGKGAGGTCKPGEAVTHLRAGLGLHCDPLVDADMEESAPANILRPQA